MIAVSHLALALVVVSCRTERVPPRPADSASVVAPPTASQTSVPSTWRTIAWEPHAGVDPTDVGLGVVFLRRAEDKSGTVGTDTLLLRAAPTPTAPLSGAMLFVVSTNGVTSYRVAAADSLVPNLVEYGYEESGVPFDSVDASGRWLRGLLGTTPDGTMRVAWMDTTQRGVGTVR